MLLCEVFDGALLVGGAGGGGGAGTASHSPFAHCADTLVTSNASMLMSNPLNIMPNQMNRISQILIKVIVVPP